MPSKPKVFIGSSRESLDYARAVQQELGGVAECTRWDQADAFRLNRSYLESLLEARDAFDFAVFVFAPDDVATVRDQTYRMVRDNVTFEFGLFLGAIGRDRAFAIAPEETEHADGSAARTMSDLAGIKMAQYNAKAASLSAAVSRPCNEIAIEIQRRGTLTKAPTLLESIATNVTEIETMVRSLNEMISTRYLGRFPDFFQTKIIPGIEKASKAIYIGCDFPTYGFFSAPPVYAAYMNALETKRKQGLQIHAVFLSGERRREATRLQMPDAKAWEQVKQQAGFAEKLKIFSGQINKDINSPADLERYLNESHDYRLAKFKSDIATTCFEVDSPMPIYLWIADGERAIFSIPQFGPEPTEHGFETSNPQLVGSLQLLWERYKGVQQLAGQTAH